MTQLDKWQHWLIECDDDDWLNVNTLLPPLLNSIRKTPPHCRRPRPIYIHPPAADIWALICISLPITRLPCLWIGMTGMGWGAVTVPTHEGLTMYVVFMWASAFSERNLSVRRMRAFAGLCFQMVLSCLCVEYAWWQLKWGVTMHYYETHTGTALYLYISQYLQDLILKYL